MFSGFVHRGAEVLSFVVTVTSMDHLRAKPKYGARERSRGRAAKSAATPVPRSVLVR